MIWYGNIQKHLRKSTPFTGFSYIRYDNIDIMTKELQTSLVNIQEIKSIAELSILMDALAMRMRELLPEQEVEIPQDVKDKIKLPFGNRKKNKDDNN